MFLLLSHRLLEVQKQDIPDNVEISINSPDYNLIVRLPNSDDLFNNDDLQIIQNCILNQEENQVQTPNPKLSLEEYIDKRK